MALPGDVIKYGKQRGTPSPGMELDINDVVQDVWAWRAEMLARSPLLERGAMPVVQSDVINRIQTTFFQQAKGVVTLAVDAVVDTYTVTLSGGHGAVAGDLLVLFEDHQDDDPHLYIGEILNVATDVLTLDRPLTLSFMVADVFALLSTAQMAVDGSSTRQLFRVQPPIGYSWDITRLIVTMTLSGAPDDGKFGSIAAGITSGITLRVVRDYGTEFYNIANWKDNGQIAGSCYDLTYTTRSGGTGDWGLRARWTFGGTSKMGAVVRLRGGDNPIQGPQDRIEIAISDDLTDLVSFRTSVQGHWVDIVWNGE